MTLTSTLSHKFCSSRRPILETNQPGKINMEPENHPSARGKSSWTKPSWCVSSRSFSTVKLKLFFFLFEVVDFGNFLHDERCWGVDCGNKCLGFLPGRLGCHAEEMYLKGAKNCFNEWYFGYTPLHPRDAFITTRIVTSFFGNRESQDIPSY